MTQSRRTSVIEAVANVAVGLVVSLALQLVLFPDFPVAAQLRILAIFTAVSVARSYLVRRAFNRWRNRQFEKKTMNAAPHMHDRVMSVQWDFLAGPSRADLNKWGQTRFSKDLAGRYGCTGANDRDLLNEFGERLEAFKRKIDRERPSCLT